MENNVLSEFCCINLFSIEELKGIKILAGSKNITNRITRVNIVEVPDIDNWVHENEFLITTCYPYKNNLDELLRLIPKLAEKKVAALGIKPKRFIDTIPKEVIDCAEALNFPLFELPPQTTFSNVVREVMEQIIYGETKYLSILQERIETVSKKIIQGNSLQEILQLIEEMINNPVFIVSDSEYFIVTDTTGELVETNKSRLKWENLKRIKDEKPSIVMINGANVRIRIFELEDSQAQTFAVAVPEINSTCSSVDTLTIRRLLNLISLKLKTDSIYVSVESKYLDQFIYDWIFGGIRTSRDFQMRTRLYGYTLPDNLKYRVAIVKNNNEQESFYNDKSLLSRFRIYEAAIGTKTWLTIYEGKIVVIISYNPKGELREPEILKNITATLCRVSNNEKFSLCISDDVCNPLNIPKAFEEAKNIYSSSCISGCSEEIITWDKLGIYSILTLLKPGTNIKKFLCRNIGPLIRHDREHNTQLLETLETYFRSGNSIKDTAANMFLHYNTILYRLEKIKKLLNIKLEKNEELLELNLAVKLNSIHICNFEEEI
ncbi:PucR family transcriptional regulator [Ruminiclostridium cellobioparum]|jgi:purine catabolism regulator|uniref:PucR family transcriptional regulator n=1 Tax=Ruminiclostridium cellobioparum TaxID=29355 RepID=UPI000686F469|nr:PucR family transcriptional regulator [Ruminiclostridium cellobioparum]